MLKAIWIFLAVVVAPGAAYGQGSAQPVVYAYGFAGWGGTYFGDIGATLHVGLGGEMIVAERLALGAEIGRLGPVEDFDDGFEVLSFNAAYHFVPRDSPRRLTPFATAGYSVAFPTTTLSLLNFGGGLQYWIRKNVGVRFEFRDHLPIASYTDDQLWGLRVAVCLGF